MPILTKTRKFSMILLRASAIFLLALASLVPARGDAPQSASKAKPESVKATTKENQAGGSKPVSFMGDVAPILVRNCIACHNPKKSESKYVMTSFTQLAKGGKQCEGITLAPGKPDDSYFLDVLQPDAEPRMLYKLDPLPQDEIKLLERWVAEGARYDGTNSTEDWTFLLRKTRTVTIPEAYPVTVPITALAFSPDGQQIAASGYHEITFWKTADGVLDHRVAGLSERTYGIVYSGDGRWLATASGDPGQYGLVRLWSLGKGGVKPVRDLAESQDAVFAVAFSPDGKRLATAGADRIIRVYETETGKLLVQIEDHADWIFDIAFSPDGNRLASASRDKTSKVFDVVKKESLVTFTGHGQPVYTVAFRPDGKAVATGGEDNEIRIWTTEGEAKQVRGIGGFGGTVFKLRYSPDGNILAACSGDKSVRLFKAQNGSQVRFLAGHADWVYSLAFSPDSKTLASGSWDGEVRLWNLADGKPGQTIIAAPGFKPKADGSHAAR
ncbi:MAG: c-type cytochrome domain-containing protein [Isosphaeraceae bacterium]